MDQRHNGGGWTVVADRRPNGHLSFDLPWDAFKQGFGTPQGEHWLGG